MTKYGNESTFEIFVSKRSDRSRSSRYRRMSPEERTELHRFTNAVPSEQNQGCVDVYRRVSKCIEEYRRVSKIVAKLQ